MAKKTLSQLVELNPGFTLMGAICGYPPCCIQEFIEYFATVGTKEYVPRTKRKFQGTGYVPCKACNRKTMPQILKVIRANRDPRMRPFPNDSNLHMIFDLITKKPA